jgi:hypothetical protein
MDIMFTRCVDAQDKVIAKCMHSSELIIRQTRQQMGLNPVVKQIDTVAAEYPAFTNYLYLTYNATTDDIPASVSLCSMYDSARIVIRLHGSLVFGKLQMLHVCTCQAVFMRMKSCTDVWKCKLFLHVDNVSSMICFSS